MRFPNQVWSVDMTCMPVGRSHMCLTCVIDRFSRYVVGWRLADGMAAPGVAACMRGASDEHGEPAIVDSDQGSVFSSAQYEGLLKGRRVMQSMDGKARWVNNVIVERWFGSPKSEWLRTDEYPTPLELRRLVARYVDQCNSARPHESLGYETPESWCHSGLMAA